MKECGQVVSAYCHWDGYPSGVGKSLKTEYKTVDAALALIARGDMSSLGTGYYADRGEKCPPMVSESLKAFLRACQSGEEYAYVLMGGAWYAFDLHGKEPEYVGIPD